MTVALTQNDRQMLDGRHGEATRLAMSILVRMAEVCAADEMMDVTAAHIDGCGFLSDAGVELAETLAATGGRVSIPTTLNMGPLDLDNWRDFGVPEDFARKAIRQADAYAAMGCVPTWTCAPYQGYLTPRFGQQIAWGESNAVVYANSVLGARTNRYGDYFDICAAITGRVPKQGLHLKENRRGQIVLRLVDVGAEMWRDDASFAALGHLLGRVAGERVPVIEGLPADAGDDQLKALGAAAASSGAVALFHAVGVTPEAPTLEEALGGDSPRQVIDVRVDDLLAARADLSTAEEGEKLDLVVLGCPHFSFAEFRRLAELLDASAAKLHLSKGKPLHPDVKLVVLSSHTSYALARRAGWIDVLEKFAVRTTLDTCPFHTPLVEPGVKVMMTNSGKCAYYAPGELGVKVAFGSMADCVRSAVAGRVLRGEP